MLSRRRRLGSNFGKKMNSFMVRRIIREEHYQEVTGFILECDIPEPTWNVPHNLGAPCGGRMKAVVVAWRQVHDAVVEAVARARRRQLVGAEEALHAVGHTLDKRHRFFRHHATGENATITRANKRGGSQGPRAGLERAAEEVWCVWGGPRRSDEPRANGLRRDERPWHERAPWRWA
jgi:hypothetical protein